MAKLQVVEPSGETRMPFLRGILTRSLQGVGLSFDEGYKIAADVRDSLSGDSEISTEQLRGLVAEHLRQSHGDSTAHRYLAFPEPVAPILVEDAEGQQEPFSAETHRRTLEVSGLSESAAAKLTGKLYRHLVMRDRKRISSSYLGRLTYRYLCREAGNDVANRYLVWREYRDRDLPLLVLIGGAPGTGKSTIATEVASRLGIFRTQSTDMLREVMRMMLPERLLPVLHRSSFDAYKSLSTDRSNADLESRIVLGYHNQTDLLVVPSEAVVQRAIRERVSLVLEGVHVGSTLVDRLPAVEDVVVVPIMLAVLKRQQLKQRIRGRGGAVPRRRAERYLQNFDAIWQLQSQLLDEADRTGIPMVTNDDKENTVREIMRIIVDKLARTMDASLELAFPE